MVILGKRPIHWVPQHEQGTELMLRKEASRHGVVKIRRSALPRHFEVPGVDVWKVLSVSRKADVLVELRILKRAEDVQLL